VRNGEDGTRNHQPNLQTPPHPFRIAVLFRVLTCSDNFFILNGELAGIRTQDQRLKRAMLYQLSYELSPISKLTQFRSIAGATSMLIFTRYEA
jgi:hypothetical protein